MKYIHVPLVSLILVGAQQCQSERTYKGKSVSHVYHSRGRGPGARAGRAGSGRRTRVLHSPERGPEGNAGRDPLSVPQAMSSLPPRQVRSSYLLQVFHTLLPCCLLEPPPSLSLSPSTPPPLQASRPKEAAER